MKSKHIARAIGVLAALSDEHYDKDADYEGQTTEWHNLRSAMYILKNEIEEVSKKEVTQ